MCARLSWRRRARVRWPFFAPAALTPDLIEISAGETKEYCLALFLFVYLLGLARDLRAAGSGSAPQSL